MAPDLAFDVLQTPDGDALFFSIGTDHVFYVTRETRGGKTGWNKIDLSSTLASSHDGKPIAAKTFAITQNPQSHAIDLALVITVTGVDFLFTSFDNSPTAEIWEQGITWTLMTFDAPSVPAPNPLTIADVYMLNLHGQQGDGPPSREVCFVDILRQPGDPLQLLDRYYIESSHGPHWKPHGLAVDLKAGSIASCLGNRSNDPVPGIYTFGAIEDTKELIYAPQYNFWDPHVAPRPARLSLPDGATAVSSCLNADGVTNLFVAASKGLYVFSPDNQHDQAIPILASAAVVIGKSNVLAGVTSLASMTVSGHTAVWGTNAQGDLFYTTCAAGKETNSSSWSLPFPICSGVERFTFYVNNCAANNVVFAHISGQRLLQLTQDPQTGRWMTRSILLPTTNFDHVTEMNCFTTHLQVLNDDSIPLADCAVNIISTSQVTVYINDVYHILTPTFPVTVSSDVTGAITIIQETQSLSAVQYQVATASAPITALRVNPLSKALQTLSGVKNGDDLKTVSVQDRDGDQRKLLPDSVSDDLRDGVAKSITNLIAVHNELPADGTVQRPSVQSPNLSLNDKSQQGQPIDLAPNSDAKLSWGMSFHNGTCEYHDGNTALRNVGLPVIHGLQSSGSTPLKGFGDFLNVDASDMFYWFKHAWGDIERFTIEQADNLYHFTIQIAGQVYKAVLDCISKVVDAIEFILNKIELFMEELIMWLGFLFNWKDIKRTHRVIRNMVKLYARKAVNSLVTLEDRINNAFVGIEDKVNSWAGITDPGEEIGIQTLTGSTLPGSNTAQANWGMYHLKNGANLGSCSPSTNRQPPDSLLEQALKDLTDLVEQEGDFISMTIQQINDQVILQMNSLTPMGIFKRLVGILADLSLKTARNILVKLIDVIRIVSDLILDFLDAPADIPVISWVYKLVTGNDLTLIDLMCFVAAIPTTIICKVISGKAPFPDDRHTEALIEAQDFETFKSHFVTPSVSAAVAVSTATDGGGSAAQKSLLRDDITGTDTAAGIFNILGGIGSLGVMIFSSLKRGFSNDMPLVDPKKNPVEFFGICLFVSHILYLFPNIPLSNFSEFANIVNDSISLLDLLKCGLDNLAATHWPDKFKSWKDKPSAAVESTLNLLWVLPACETFGTAVQSHNLRSSIGTTWAANMSFDLGGILSYPAADTTDEALVAFVVQQGFNGLYTVFCWTTAGLLFDGK
ncbi:hypothetical protein G6514_001495 [Epicoccum nigrum]|nr:hypothetical protein G6514_001495 [Epicoccum nigrum]